VRHAIHHCGRGDAWVGCALSGRRIRFSPGELFHVAIVGILLLMGGNTHSFVRPRRVVPTGLAALLIAVTPLWFLVLDSWLLGDHHHFATGQGTAWQ